MKTPTLRTHTANQAASSSSSRRSSNIGNVLLPLRRRTLRPVFVSSLTPQRSAVKLRLAA